MPLAEISESTFAKLKHLAEPFVDTPESVIARLADAELLKRGAKPNDRPGAPVGADVISLNVDSHESLTFTRVLSATVGGQEIHRAKWNSILDQLHVVAFKRLGSFDAVRKVTSARIRPGRYEDDGYSYLPDANLSLQGVDANKAWDYSLGLVRALSLSITVEFEWRENDDAAHPGKRGVLHWQPKTQEK